MTVTERVEKKIVPFRELREIGQQAYGASKDTVFTTGAFERLRPGHIDHIRFCKETGAGALLIVGVESDAVLARKQPGRSFVPAAARLVVVSALRDVDYVCELPELEEGKLIQDVAVNLFRPTFYALHCDAFTTMSAEERKSWAKLQHLGTRVVTDFQLKFDPEVAGDVGSSQ